MGVYPYCVVPAQHAPPAGLTGLEDAPVELARIGAVGLWISEIDRPELGVQGVRQHNSVVEAAVTEQITPVPLRFGQWLADRAALAAQVTDRAGHYEAQLARFAGCLEFGVRALDPAAPEEARDVHTSGAASGREYMQALRESSKLADRKRVFAESVASRVHDLLHDVVREEKVESALTRHAVLTVSHLVARPQFNEYRGRARQLRSSYPALRWLLSGPWPPYSFAA